jgi:hypothetical protein
MSASRNFSIKHQILNHFDKYNLQWMLKIAALTQGKAVKNHSSTLGTLSFGQDMFFKDFFCRKINIIKEPLNSGSKIQARRSLKNGKENLAGSCEAVGF